MKHLNLLIAGALLALGGCASTQLDAEWTDPQFAATSLRGERVLVTCETPEFVVKQLCEERVAAEVTARGATPLIPREAVDPNAYAAAARDAGAAAALVVRVSPATARSSMPFSIGLGGFGVGSGGFGGGVGVSMPMGGGRTDLGYAANSQLTQASSGRLMWSGRATAAPSSDLSMQLDELSKAVLKGAQGAGFF